MQDQICVGTMLLKLSSQATQLLNDGQAASDNLALVRNTLELRGRGWDICIVHLPRSANQVDYACKPEEVQQPFQSCGTETESAAANKLDQAGFQNIACITSGLQTVKPGTFDSVCTTKLQDASKAGLVTIQGKNSAVLGTVLISNKGSGNASSIKGNW
ncbi:hypothetical protein GOBAR_AA17495 [Gossypium barbadense]|uniref:Uncharacterized protein n=1 Tax=Gossypium barbadense TaxID=3634 RepID=A0A2P5XII9_GOSBA|nr:hypothetical protein GOBAR_AA17495 [Gossypium barbadense]